ncbi:TonB-dependent receptor [Pseudidiomarina sp. 1APP75-32.1]|uniref:TonB-dependent receptor n=1 Tax=Pseudidiomarina terrestris TaxID=2820060 RepID=A0AAW7R0A0_9GAMM|nr:MULTISPECIES: TonB-dependent receptor [unclassified Pseudidiomarina]MDN7125121.1 TonB-dependent receptor [Pseudidiomarina sp. 1APP75-32.1]MDN7129882.1 TonB-dependent receptor [Pseudidiomarina sp. 1APR75-15]MDN7138427.1 TonB-dependent receptor [Pseudidiomarina sp. 1ASP75-14]
MLNKNPSRIAAAIALAIGLSATATAQETSSSLRGVVTSEATGQAIANASVTLRDERTGTTTTFSANDSGLFSARGLAVGGPYTLTVTDAMGNSEVVENVYLTLGETENVRVQVAQQTVERISVEGRRLTMTSGASSPASNFNLRDIQNQPAPNRDIKDVVQIDPRIYINETNARDIQCGGGNPRFNSLTVDGVRTNDNFGLNSSGYPTERMPFSYDAIEQVAVELAPFDVEYGGFTACNINAVTKSGENELFGSVFFDYTNDSLTGDELEGEPVNIGAFNEKRYGFNGGGALIKDKLFAFIAYEKLEGSDTFDRGPEDASVATPVQGVTQADLDRIAAIARNVYNFEPGGFPASLPVEDEKFLAKLDWYINQDHRASFTYNYNDGYSIAESDGDSDELEFSNHFYERGAEFNSYVAQLYSDWTYNFSTELRAGYSELENRVEPLGGNDIGEVQIRHNGNTIYLGADDSRHANKLAYDTSFYKLSGTYLLDDHTLTFGYEYESYDVFNLFIQEAQGEHRFNSIDDFESGLVDRLIYENAAGTNNPNDGAAQFEYAVNTLYGQDEYYFIDYDLTLTLGLRYDWYTTSDAPTLNQAFLDTYGFENTATLDGEGLIQPRLGVNWVVNDQLEVRGGFGLYSGGNPNVWLSNNYSNNGVTLYEANRFDVNLFDLDYGSGSPIIDVPVEMIDEVATAAGRGPVNALDPDFEIPNEWKFAVGATYVTENDYVLMADFLHTRKQDAAIIKDLRAEQSGTAPDGRPIYSRNGSDAFLLTNVDGDSGEQTSISFAVSKDHDWGFNWSLAYAWNKSEDVNPMTSSVAYSNYTSVATADAENPGIATSNYEIPHRFTFRGTYTKEFFSGYDTTFSLFGSANKGRPYSFTMNAPVGDITRGRSLLYVPTGENDSNVAWGDDLTSSDIQEFLAFIEESGLSQYAGGIAPRNEFNSDWWHKVDLKVEQELPGFMQDHKSRVYFVVDNFTNMLNDDWGVLYETSFPRSVNVAEVGINDQNQWVFEDITPRINQVQGRAGQPSLWSVRLGFQYDF